MSNSNCQFEKILKIKTRENKIYAYKKNKLRYFSPYYPYLLKVKSECYIEIEVRRVYNEERYLKRLKKGLNIIPLNQLEKNELLNLLKEGNCEIANISTIKVKDRKGEMKEKIDEGRYYLELETGEKPAILKFNIEKVNFEIPENIRLGNVYWIYLNNRCRISFS